MSYRNRRRNTAWSHILVGILTFASASTQAASFDCNKAGTPVERAVCADASLSRLDEVLAGLYRRVFESASDKESVRHSQREWLVNIRNTCANTECVANAYNLRLSQLATAATPTSSSAKQAGAVRKSYPPYPDIWHWQIKNAQAIAPGVFSLSLLNNGDVLVLFAERTRAEPPGSHTEAANRESGPERTLDHVQVTEGKDRRAGDYVLRQFTLFGNQTVKNAESNVAILRGQIPILELSDGSSVQIIKKEGSPLTTRDGSTISWGTTTKADCYRGPANYFFSKRDQTNKVVWEKVLFLMLDQPEHFQAGMSGLCPEGKYPDLVRRVKARSGNMLLLPDGTFLLNGGDGLIIRFDEDFNSKSSLLNQRIFVLERGGVQIVPPAANVRGRIYYPRGPGGPYLYQEALDDVYQYLLQQRRKAK